MARPIKNVAIVGADGSLGPSVLQALCEAGFTVTALKRASSKTVSNYPEGVTEKRVSDAFEIDDITQVLRGQDAIVNTMPGGKTDIQKKIADACIKAGVRKMIPADFGSVDSGSERAMELVPLYKHKTELRSYLTQLAEKNDAFTWTSLVCGHFFDYSLDFLHIYPKEHRADVGCVSGDHGVQGSRPLGIGVTILLMIIEHEQRVSCSPLGFSNFRQFIQAKWRKPFVRQTFQ